MRRAGVLALAGVWLLVWLWTGTGLAGGTGEVLLAAGRQAYAAGRYAEAATAFAAAARTEPAKADADLCLDVAMAWRLAGDSGQAAYWLYRAGSLAPGEAAVKKAQAAANLAPLAPDLPLGSRLPPRLLWLVVLGANAVFWLTLAAARLFSRPLPRPILVLWAVLLVWLWCEAGWPALSSRLFPKGVVLVAAPAQSAPEAGAETLFSLPPGTLVALGPTRQTYVRAETRAGQAGWIARDRIATLSW